MGVYDDTATSCYSCDDAGGGGGYFLGEDLSWEDPKPISVLLTNNKRAIERGRVYLQSGYYFADDHGYLSGSGRHAIFLPGGTYQVDADGIVRVPLDEQPYHDPDGEPVYFTCDSESRGEESLGLSWEDPKPNGDIYASIRLRNAPLYTATSNLKELAAMPKTPAQINEEKMAGQKEAQRQRERQLILDMNKLTRQMERLEKNWSFALRSLLAVFFLVGPTLATGWFFMVTWAITAAYTLHQNVGFGVFMLSLLFVVLTAVWCWGIFALFNFAHTAWKTLVLTREEHAAKQDELAY